MRLLQLRSAQQLGRAAARLPLLPAMPVRAPLSTASPPPLEPPPMQSGTHACKSKGLRETQLALTEGKAITDLDLSDANLLCVNIMCERLGEACACRLARVLESVAASQSRLQTLSLAGNRLRALPEAVFAFPELQVLDLSRNALDAEATRAHVSRRLRKLRSLIL
jgi:Leucine-rich repeat (LRR) protein